MRISFIPVVLSLLIISGCGDAFKRLPYRDYTEVRVESLKPAHLQNLFEPLAEGPSGLQGESAIMPLAAPVVDAVIFATSSSMASAAGRKYIAAASFNTISWTIPNGSYYFSLIGYDNANMGGAAKCALGSADGGSAGGVITLAGGSKTVSFTAGTCGANSAFKGANNYTNIRVAICTAGTDITALGATDACNTSGGAAATNITGFKISYTSQDEFNGPGGALSVTGTGDRHISGCIGINTTTGVATANVPAIGGSASVSANTNKYHFKTEVFTFSGTDCATPQPTYSFPSGLATAGLGTGAVGSFAAYTTYLDSSPNSTKARWVEAVTPTLYLKQ